MRGSGTRPPTAALFASPIHAKFSDTRKLRKALCERAFNSYMLTIHPHDLEKSQKKLTVPTVVDLTFQRLNCQYNAFLAAERVHSETCGLLIHRLLKGQDQRIYPAFSFEQ
jgi:hypothetical protein